MVCKHKQCVYTVCCIKKLPSTDVATDTGTDTGVIDHSYGC